MSKIKLIIKPTQGDSKYTVEAERTWTVADLKEGVAKEADITVEDQKLIYKGKILKDDDVLQDLGSCLTRSLICWTWLTCGASQI